MEVDDTNARVQRKGGGDQPLPECQDKADDRKQCQDERKRHGVVVTTTVPLFKVQSWETGRAGARSSTNKSYIWSMVTTRRISSRLVSPAATRRKPFCHMVCIPWRMATSCKARVGSFCKTESRKTSSETSSSVTAVRPLNPVLRHSPQPVPRRNSVVETMSAGKPRSKPGSG